MCPTPLRFTTVLGLLLLSALAALPEMAAESAKPAPLALLVAVTNYEGTGLRNLQFTTRDIDELAAELKKQGFQTTVLKNDKATKAAIEAALQELAEGRHKGQMLLVALSGHGLQSIGEDGKEDAYFCPSDTDKARNKNLLSLSTLVQSMGNRGTNLVLVDACRNDPKKGTKNFEGNELNGKLPAETAVLFSCAAGQASLETNRMYGETSEQGHGVFFYHVLEGLRGKARNTDGKVEWYDLVRYVKNTVNAKAKEWDPERASAEAERRGVDLESLKFQTPHLLNNLDDSPVLASVPKDGPDEVRTKVKPGEEREYEVGGGVKMKFCWIPPGKAKLGSPKSELDAVSEQLDKGSKEMEWFEAEAEEMRPEHTSKGFWLGKFAVTQEEWMAVMGGKSPSWFCKDGVGKTGVPADTSRFPVEQVSWEDCQKFLDKLNDAAAGDTLVKVFGKRGKFVLPHEDEWEYACRGGKGNRRAYYFGNELNGTQANCDGNSPFGTSTKGTYLQRPTAVGSYEKDYPHPWGLCDMHGNVYQWCENNYSDDPKKGRALRGGSWLIHARWCRSALRYRCEPGTRNYYIGCRACFRLD